MRGWDGFSLILGEFSWYDGRGSLVWLRGNFASLCLIFCWMVQGG